MTPLGTDEVILAARKNNVCGEILTGAITWHESPMSPSIIKACSIPAYGCSSPWYCTGFYVDIAVRDYAWQTPLANEIGYWVWYQCFGRIGEYYDPVTGEEHLEPELAAWMQKVNLDAIAMYPLIP